MSGQGEPVRVVDPAFGFEDLSLEELRELWKNREVSTTDTAQARRDYVRLTALRAEIFSRLQAPASVKKWGKEAGK